MSSQDADEATEDQSNAECECTELHKKAAIKTEGGTVLHVLYECQTCGEEQLE